MTQPNGILQSSVPGLALGDYEDRTPGPVSPLPPIQPSQLPASVVSASLPAAARSLGARSAAGASNGIVWVKEKLTLADPRWGAAFDGVTDDTAAFLLASAAGGQGAVIELPPGSTVLKDFAFAAAEQRLVGAGIDSTLITAAAAAGFVAKILGITNCGLADLTLDGNARASSCLQIAAAGAVGSQHHSFERVRFRNGSIGVSLPNPGATNQADKNTYYHCQWDACTTGMNIAAPNAQEQILINPSFAGLLNKAIDISGGTLTIIGGQIQTVVGAGIGIDVTGANVAWIRLADFITEGTATDVVLSGGKPTQGIKLDMCTLQGSAYCVDPAAQNGALLIADGSVFNTGAVGRATAGDFCFLDRGNQFQNGAAWVPSTNYPRRIRMTTSADNPFGLLVDSFGSKFTAFAGGVALAIAGPLQNALAAQEATTATAGANGAVPAQVKGYLIAQDHTGTAIKIPYFAA